MTLDLNKVAQFAAKKEARDVAGGPETFEAALHSLREEGRLEEEHVIALRLLAAKERMEYVQEILGNARPVEAVKENPDVVTDAVVVEDPDATEDAAIQAAKAMDAEIEARRAMEAETDFVMEDIEARKGQA